MPRFRSSCHHSSPLQGPRGVRGWGGEVGNHQSGVGGGCGGWGWQLLGQLPTFGLTRPMSFLACTSWDAALAGRWRAQGREAAALGIRRPPRPPPAAASSTGQTPLTRHAWSHCVIGRMSERHRAQSGHTERDAACALRATFARAGGLQIEQSGCCGAARNSQEQGQGDPAEHSNCFALRPARPSCY